MSIRYLSGINVDSNVLFVDSANNRVGVGTGSPADKLHVNAGSVGGIRIQADTEPALYLNTTDGTSNVNVFNSYGNFGIEGLKTTSNYIMYHYGGGGTAANQYTYFQTAGVERVRITGAGNVGIGTTSPSSKLTIAGNIEQTSTSNTIFTNNIAVVSSAANLVLNSSSANLIIPNGNVGIGTTSPAQKLHVDGALKLTSNPSVTADGSAAYFWNQAGVGPTIGGFKFQIQTNGSSVAMVVDENQRVGIGTTSPSAKLDVIGTARILAADAPTSSELTAKILAYSPAPYGMVLRAYSSGTNSIQVQRESNDAETFALVLNPNGGAVGIGTTSPTAKLDVYNTSNAEMRISTASEGYLLLGQYTNGGFIGTSSSDATAGVLRLGTAGTERMRITAGGNVGIGTTAPAYKLDVSGTFHTSGDATFNGTNVYINSSYIYVGNNTGDLVSISGNTMYFPGDGKVGIGTTAPFSKTTIAVPATNTISADDQANTAGLTIAGSDALVRLQLGVGSNLVGPYGGWIQASYDNGGVDYGVEPLVLNPVGGNVGIGTTLPMGPLEVYKANTSGLGGHIILNNNGQAVGNETAVLFNDSGAGSVGYVRAAISSSVEGSPYYGDLKFKTGASSYASLNTRMIITGGGNVGIGLTNPTRPLHVLGGDSGSGTHIAHFEGRFGVVGMYIRGNGNVGIGTTSPSFPLSVAGKIGGTLFSDSHLEFLGSGNTILKANNDVVIGYLQSFYVTQGGNVGIGTTTPNYPLHVKGGSVKFESQSNLTGFFKANTTQCNISFEDTSNGSNDIVYIGSIGNNFMIATNYDERVRVNSSGNLGIATTNPTAKLHVNGTVRMDNQGAAVSNQYGPGGGNTVGDVIGNNSDNRVLGSPDVWLRINVDGTNYVFPGYVEP